MDNLIRLVLRIYTASTVDVQKIAMDLFDRLIQQFSGEAYKVLAEWES